MAPRHRQPIGQFRRRSGGGLATRPLADRPVVHHRTRHRCRTDCVVRGDLVARPASRSARHGSGASEYHSPRRHGRRSPDGTRPAGSRSRSGPGVPWRWRGAGYCDLASGVSAVRLPAITAAARLDAKVARATAANIDFTSFLGGRTLLCFGVVLLLSFLLL